MKEGFFAIYSCPKNRGRKVVMHGLLMVEFKEKINETAHSTRANIGSEFLPMKFQCAITLKITYTIET